MKREPPFTKDEYRAALLAIKPQDHERELLRTHYRAPNHTITAAELADAMEYANWGGVNLQYGKLAEKFCDYFNVQVEPCLNVLVTATKQSANEHWRLTLHDELVDAIRELKWYG